MNVNPPNWADRFLRWYCNPKYLEEIEGDIYELFDRRIEIKGSFDKFGTFDYCTYHRYNH